MKISEIVIDRVSRVAPLGLRFWDPAANSFVSDGLQVTAIPKAGSVYAKPAAAVPNRSGIFAFHHLPGLPSEIEFGKGDHDYWNPQPPMLQKEFIVTVKDLYERFLSFQISVKAPTQKLLTWSCLSGNPSPLPQQPDGVIPLFSAAGRPAPGGMAAIRAMIAASSGSPAAWALVEAKCESKLVARSVADEKGQVVLYFPYPKFVSESQQKPLTAQRWPIELNVFFSLSPPFPKIPDLCVLMDQANSPKAQPLECLLPSALLGKITLKYGEELIVKTQSKSELFLQ